MSESVKHGVVRGMCGSPIIQDSKLADIRVHILAKDSKDGYGIFIENMLEAAEKSLADNTMSISACCLLFVKEIFN